ncbi:MAG: signal peptidase I [Spirochaetales bacterium]|nr:signal peptidase I [Spirochaetales bacterium]
MKKEKAGRYLREWTEGFLTRRKRKKLIKKERLKRKHPVRDWIEAILLALLIVTVIQYFIFELYVIPTGSMKPTIEIGTRAVVDKFVFGPELLPPSWKRDIFRNPRRGEVVVLENPDKNLAPMHPVKKFLHRIIFRLTLTLVDIDTDKGGHPKQRLLLKRVIGIPGERIRVRNRDIQLLPKGEKSWITEEALKRRLSLDYPIFHIAVTPSQSEKPVSGLPPRYEPYARQPYDWEFVESWRKYTLGWYIPETRFFPMGDNRDNSHDARAYGPVPVGNLIGKAVFRIWPPSAIGIIR